MKKELWGSSFMCPSSVWDIENGVLRKKRARQSGINWNSLFIGDCGMPLTSEIGEEYWTVSNLEDYVVVMAAAVSPFGNSCIGFQKCPFGLIKHWVWSLIQFLFVAVNCIPVNMDI